METEQLTTKRKTGQDRNKDTEDFLEVNENEDIIYPHLQDIVKAFLSRKFIVLSVYIKKKNKAAGDISFY